MKPLDAIGSRVLYRHTFVSSHPQNYTLIALKDVGDLKNLWKVSKFPREREYRESIVSVGARHKCTYITVHLVSRHRSSKPEYNNSQQKVLI